MAFGKHWEWRGFGDVSGDFSQRFTRLSPDFEPQEIDDLYIWAPGLEINLKLREGAEEGLKFKRFVEKEGALECWSEKPEEVFDFPLAERGWQKLAVELARVNRVLGLYPQAPPGRAQLLAALGSAGCMTVPVSKRREGRWWQGPNGRVLVERSEIYQPQQIASVSLESEDIGQEGAALTGEQVRVDLRAAIEELGLEREPLVVLNYMDALALWARGDTITW